MRWTGIGFLDPPYILVVHPVDHVLGVYYVARQVNACTRPDLTDPLLIIKHLLQDSNDSLFSVIDLRLAFYQKPIALE